MKKTIHVNIGRTSFVIDEDAYTTLKSYLDNIQRLFTSSDGKEEIMEDIELRIAELLDQKRPSKDAVVVLADINGVIQTMGKPEEYTDGQAESLNDHVRNDDNTQTEHQQSETKKGFRRLYRDPQGRVLGGVCAGLSYYFGIDRIWIRILLLCSFFFFNPVLNKYFRA